MTADHERRPSGLSFSGGPQIPRLSRALAGIAALLAATMVVVGFVAVYSTHSPGGNAVATSTIHATATATSTDSPTATPIPTQDSGAFVCADPAGSHLTYVYRRRNLGVYLVVGCQTRQIFTGKTGSNSTFTFPVAWSLHNRYLAVMIPGQNQTYPIFMYEISTGRTIATRYMMGYENVSVSGTVFRRFLGWVDDTTFLGAIQPVNSPGPSTIVRVDVASQRETTVGTITWFAGAQVVAPNYLFYGGYQSANEGHASLHRLDLRTGEDTQFVSLGLYGTFTSGCTVRGLCNWTAPWVVTLDGVNVIYHNPPPTSMPPAVDNSASVQDTPLAFATLGSLNARYPFGTSLQAMLSTPGFSPQGDYATAAGDGSTFLLAQIGGEATMLQGKPDGFRADDQALVTVNMEITMLYDLNTHTMRPLEQESEGYLWAH